MFSFLKPPNLIDINQARTARLIHVILLALILILTPLFFVEAVVSRQNYPRWLALMIAIDGLCVALLIQIRRGRVRLASRVMVGFAWFYVLVATLVSGGPHSQIIWFYLVVALFAGILLGGRAGLLTGLACGLATLAIWLSDAAGIRVDNLSTNPAMDFWMIFLASLALVAFLQYMATRSIHESLDQANHELVERRLAEQRLGESEQKYRSIVERSTDGLLLLDEQGRIIEYNQALERITGIPCEQALGMNVWDFQFLITLPEKRTPANYQKIHSTFQQAIQTGEMPAAEREIESRFQRADGQIRVGSQKVFAIPTEKGFRLAAISRDVTESRNADKAIRHSQQRLSLLVEQSPLAVIEWDITAHVLSWNPAAERIFGYSREEALGQTAYDLIVPADEQARVKSIWTQIQTGLASIHGVNDNITRAGRRIICEWFNSVLVDPHGKVIGIASLAVDITERKQAEDALQESITALRLSQAALNDSSETLRAIVDVSPLSISMMDLEGSMQLWNPASERIFGWSAEEVLGKPNPLIPPERLGEFQEISQQLFADGKIGEVETCRKRKDGTLIDVSLSSAIIHDAAGRAQARMAIINDITERKRAEKELLESSRRLNTTINNLRGVVYRCMNDPDWTMEYINEGILDLAGYPAEDFIGNRVRTYNSIIDPEDQARVWYDIQRALIRKQPYTLEYRIRAASGEQKWAWERGRGVFDGDQLVALEGFITNITDRKKAEEEAVNEQRRLNSLLHISQKKTESVAELLDCALEEITVLSDSPFGYIFFYNEEKQELVLHAWSKKAREACSIPDPPAIYPLESTGIWGEVVRQGGPLILNNFNDPHPLKKGFPAGHIPIQRYMSLPIFDGERVVAVVGVANKPVDYTDLDLRQLDMMMDSIWKIAERKQAETALRESEMKFRALIEQNSEGVVLTDERGCIIEWNQAIVRITGLAAEDVLGKPIWEMQLSLSPAEHRTPEQVEKLRSSLVEALRTGQAGQLSRPVEVTICRADGELVSIQQIVFPIKTALGYRLGSVTRDITDSKRSQQQIQALNADLLAAYDATIEGWAAALELRDQETEGHSERVVELTLELARRMGVPEPELVHLRRGAILHDIGKMGIPDSILLKPGPLTEEEWESMRQHPRYAFVMLIGIPFLRPATDIPYAHHERWDGSGYPRGLHAEDIPLSARMFAVVDVWDALLSNRPYRQAWPYPDVVRYLQEKAGQQFDPWVVKVFLEMVGDR